MTFGSRLLPFLVVVIGACTKPAPTPAMDSAAVAAAHAAVPALDPEVRLAAGLTLALRSHPDLRDSMFAAYRITPAGFDSLKARIAADSTKNATYLQLISGHRPARPST